MPLEFCETTDIESSQQPEDEEKLECPNGHQWEQWYEFGGPYKCPECGYVIPVEVEEESTDDMGRGDSQRSWCFFCDELTANQIVDDKLMCSECGDHKSYCAYDCPHCNYGETALIEVVPNSYRTVNSPGAWNGHEWEEVHKCPVCGKEYEYTNADY